jgi:DNA-binding transcriptional LysR family regulator
MFSVPLVAVLPQSHPLSACRSVRLEDLANEDFVLGPGDHRCGLLENIIAVCRRAGFTPRVAQEAHEMQLMLAFIAEGVGVALLPKYVMKLRKPGVVCRPLTDTSAHTDITVAWQRHSTSPAVSSFLRIIREASAAYALSNGARSSVRRPVEALSSIGQACASRAA